MKEKKDCKECGAPLENWQVKQGYDLCLECYKSKKTTRRKTSHELLHEKAIEEEGEIEEKDERKRKETRDEMEEEEEVEENFGEVNEHSEDEEQGDE